MKIGLLGGTFDPVHSGHLALALAALEQLKLNKVYFVLSPLSPFKMKEPLTSVALRLEMLQLAIKGKKNFEVGRWELRRRGPSYTVTTLIDISKEHPSHQLFLIMGSDALECFNAWKKPDKIMQLATLVIGRRPEIPLKVSDVAGRIYFLKGIFPLISSTKIRQQAAGGEVPDGVPPSVGRFIHTNRLYEK